MREPARRDDQRSSSLPPQKAFITGASSGIGAALVGLWSRPGASLGLMARGEESLAPVAAMAEQAGAQVRIFPADVADSQAVNKSIASYLDWADGVDAAVASAGINIAGNIDSGMPDATGQLFQTNMIGVANTLIPFIPVMRAQGSGSLVALGSVAGLRQLPGRTAYCASKSGVIAFMNGLRMDLHNSGVHVCTVCPGFVRTPMVASLKGPLPFMMEADEVAAAVDRAIAKKQSTVIVPWQMKLIFMALRMLPDSVAMKLVPPRMELDEQNQ